MQLLIGSFPAAVDLRVRGTFTRGTGLKWGGQDFLVTAGAERNLSICCFMGRIKGSGAWLFSINNNLYNIAYNSTLCVHFKYMCDVHACKQPFYTQKWFHTGHLYTVLFVGSMNELLYVWIYGVLDVESWKVSVQLPPDRRRAVVQTPVNRLMAQQAPRIHVDMIHHYPCVTRPLNGVTVQKNLSDGGGHAWRGRAEALNPAGARCTAAGSGKLPGLAVIQRRLHSQVLSMGNTFHGCCFFFFFLQLTAMWGHNTTAFIITHQIRVLQHKYATWIITFKREWKTLVTLFHSWSLCSAAAGL